LGIIAETVAMALPALAFAAFADSLFSEIVAAL